MWKFKNGIPNKIAFYLGNYWFEGPTKFQRTKEGMRSTFSRPTLVGDWVKAIKLQTSTEEAEVTFLKLALGLYLFILNWIL